MAFNVMTLNVQTKADFQMVASTKSWRYFSSKTFSSAENTKTWENEWGGEIFSSHGSTHSRGVIIPLKPKIDVKLENSIKFR